MAQTSTMPNGSRPQQATTQGLGQKPAQSQQQQVDPVQLLNQILDNTSDKVRTTKAVLMGRVPQIEDLLPPNMKGQGERLIQRAMLTMGGKADLGEVTPVSFIKCVLQAAELGLAIDGRLAHAVVYSNKKKGPRGEDLWEKEAQLQIDYKGLIAVARRVKTIADCYARLVLDGDNFSMRQDGGSCHLIHEPQIYRPGQKPGVILGAYAIVILPSGGWRYEWMTYDEINGIRGRSKSWNRTYKDKHDPKGPWVTDDGEMRKKTVIKRILKNYSDDPGIARALDFDDQDYVEEEAKNIPEKTSLPSGGRVTFSNAKTTQPQEPTDLGDNFGGNDEQESGEFHESEPVAEQPKSAPTVAPANSETILQIEDFARENGISTATLNDAVKEAGAKKFREMTEPQALKVQAILEAKVNGGAE